MRTITSMFTRFKLVSVPLSIITFIWLMAHGQQDPGKKDKVIWSSSSQSKIEYRGDGRESREIVIENHQYLWGPHGFVSQLTKWKVGNWEGNQCALDATAYTISPDGKQKELWTIKEEADEGRIDDDLYHTIWYGCCSAGPNHRLYNLETGNLIMEYSAELLRIELGNPPKMTRYIGYKPAETIQINPWEKDKRHIGTLTYASPDGILHRVAFRGISDEYEKAFGLGFANISLEIGGMNQSIVGPRLRDEIKGDRLYLPKLGSAVDPKQFTDYRIRIKFFNTSVVISIVDDDFDIDPNAFSGFEIIRVGLK